MNTIYLNTKKNSFLQRLLQYFGINFCVFIVLFGIVFFGTEQGDERISLYAYVFLWALFLLNFCINIARAKNALIQCLSNQNQIELVYDSFVQKKTKLYKKDTLTIDVKKAFIGSSKQLIWYIMFDDGRDSIRFYDGASSDFSYDTMKHIQDQLP